MAGPHNKKVTWWTTDLAAFCSRKNCSEKRWQKLCKKKHGDEHTYTLEGKEYYTRLRNTYTNKIRQAKKTSWEKFITESSEDVMNDPWECIYTVVFNKYKSETKITALMVDYHFVENEYDIVIALLNGLHTMMILLTQNRSPRQDSVCKTISAINQMIHLMKMICYTV